MFSSPCSLRSSQCAALIALAAAAGISRFEPAPLKPLAPAPSTLAALVASTPSIFAHYFRPASWFDPFAIVRRAEQTILSASTLGASTTLALAPAESCPPPPPATAVTLPFSPWIAVAPTPRQHFYPYAVGPPRHGTHTQLRAAGTEVPGDSPARRSLFLRIARVSLSPSGAHVIRTADSGPLPAESSSPSPAPRACPELAESGETAPAFRPRVTHGVTSGPAIRGGNLRSFSS